MKCYFLPIMQLLWALGLVPQETQYTPSAPREGVTAQQPTQQQPVTCNGDSWRYPFAGNQQLSYQFLANLGKILMIVFYCNTRVSSPAFLIIILLMLTTVSLLQNIVFMVLVAGLGLHLPTMMAGQLLWVFLTRLLD